MLLPTDVTFRVRVEMQGGAKLYALYLRPMRRASVMGSSVLRVLSEHGCGRATAYEKSNKIVTIGDKTHVSWLDTEKGKFFVKIQTLDRGTGEWSAVYTVGQAFDNHGGPALTCDSSGYRHIVYYPNHHLLKSVSFS